MKQALLMVAMALVTSVSADTSVAGSTAAAPARSNQQVSTMKIRIHIDRTPITATLADNATTRDFVSMLPLTLTLKDYESTEKIADLPGKLSTKGAPAGCDPDVGDITYYAPWGNLAIFYRDFGYSDGLIKLGKIDGDIQELNRPGTLRATIELIE